MNLAVHQTQMVWFRKLFIFFSRYSYVNSFVRYIMKHDDNADGKDGETESTNDVEEDVSKRAANPQSKKKVSID